MNESIALAERYARVAGTLDERARRAVAATEALILERHEVHGEWNYTISPHGP